MPKIIYDKESNIMTVQISDKKSVDSDAQKNVVMDYDKEGEVVRIEIMGVSLDEFKKKKEYAENFLAVEYS